MPLRRPARARGFTLIELLIVVAIIAVLAAMAIGAYRRYVHASQQSEAKVVMGMIRSGEEAYRVETLNYLGCTKDLSTYWPNPTPDDSRWVWERSTDSAYTGCWAYLNVHPDAPVRYGYTVTANPPGGSAQPGAPDGAFVTPPNLAVAPAGPWFVVGAKNAHMGKPPSLAIAASWDGTVYTEGDAD